MIPCLRNICKSTEGNETASRRGGCGKFSSFLLAVLVCSLACSISRPGKRKRCVWIRRPNDITFLEGAVYIRLLTRLTLKYIPSLGKRVNPDCKTNGT